MGELNTLLLVFPLLVGVPLTAQRVEARDGNLFCIGADGEKRQLTDTGLDSKPDLFPASGEVVYIHRKTPPPENGRGEVEPPENTQLWVVNASGAPRPRLLLRGEVRHVTNGWMRGGFFEARWSLDGRHVYFLGGFAATSFALFRLSVTTGQVRFLSPSMDWAIIPSGRWRGDLVVSRRTWGRDADGSEHYAYPFYLITPNGRTVRRVGDQSERLEGVLTRLLASK